MARNIDRLNKLYNKYCMVNGKYPNNVDLGELACEISSVAGDLASLFTLLKELLKEGGIIKDKDE